MARPSPVAEMPARLSTSLMSTRCVGPGQAHRQQRHQALAAGEHLGLVTVLGEQRDDLLDGAGRVVFERRRLHAGTVPSELEDPRRRQVLFAHLDPERRERVLDGVA